MIRSLYTAVSGMITLENQQSTIVNNISNANTTGYKSESLITKSFQEVLLQNKDKVVGNTNVTEKLGTINLGVKIDDVVTKFTQGDLKETSKSNNFAINGRGFFVVQRGDEILYTRDGSFRVDNDGYLITTTGDRVMGINNSTGNMEGIFVGNRDYVLDKNNNINIDGGATHRLALADFEDYSTLSKIGDNYYSGDNPIYNAKVTVHQGFLEMSNVNVTNAMVDMITVMRSFETNQKIINMLDETLSKAANEIGSV